MAHLPSLERLNLHDIVPTKGDVRELFRTDEDIIAANVKELLEMATLNESNLCIFSDDARATKLAKEVIDKAKNIVKAEFGSTYAFTPDIRNLYFEYLPNYTQDPKQACVHALLQRELNKQSSPEKGQKRNLLQKQAPLKT